MLYENSSRVEHSMPVVLQGTATGGGVQTDCYQRLTAFPAYLHPSYPTRLHILSDREREVLRLIADGDNTKEIAFSLGISIKTVEAHRTNIMKKLNEYSVARLTKLAIREGLAPL